MFLLKKHRPEGLISFFMKYKLKSTPPLPWASQVVLVVKNSPADVGVAGDEGLIPGLGRSPGGGHGNPLLYSCLENPMDRGAGWAAVHGVVESDTTEATRHAAHPHPQIEEEGALFCGLVFSDGVILSRTFQGASLVI